jgi:hypothetical protein
MKIALPSVSLRVLARIYEVTEPTLHNWSRTRGINREDLADPKVVLEKLRLTAKNDSPVLWHLSQMENQKSIVKQLRQLSK